MHRPIAEAEAGLSRRPLRLGYNSVVPDYQIHSLIGVSSFGPLYRGLVVDSEMDVSIQVLENPADLESSGVRRIRAEARLLAQVGHAALSRLYDLVHVDGQPALVTEFVHGSDLATLLKEEGLPSRAAYEVIAQVASALDAAFSAAATAASVPGGRSLRLVHRSVHPGNLHVDPHGGVKVVGFGLARAARVDPGAVGSDTPAIGAIRYLAPECLVDQEVGAEADVFALGCTMFEVLTGMALFDGLSHRQLFVLAGDPNRFTQFVAERCQTYRGQLGSDRAVALLRAMCAFRKAHRTRAAEVAARCDLISDSTPGLTLMQWCRKRMWTQRSGDPGPLTGRIVSGSVEPEDQDGVTTMRLPRRPIQAVDLPDLPEQTVDRLPVLGEGGASAPSTDPASGPMPWGPAEVVALYSEDSVPEPTNGRPAPAMIRRIPQLERQLVEGQGSP
ncbi:MAG: protein kinase, partial [Myxococcales bacterium]|nr:protein kinase [Myxococcales bacterium]